ncbi:MAG: hypothetical protein CMO10_15125 [Thalassospira sp.]|nr:hypothetical protein [Thalassospira sp.]
MRKIGFKLSSRYRRELASNELQIASIGRSRLDAVRKQLDERIDCANKVALVSSMDGISNVLLQLPIMSSLSACGIEPVVILPSFASEHQKSLYQMIGVRRFAYWDSEEASKEFKETLSHLSTCKTQEEVLEITWKGIHVGKFAVSTLMRRLRSGTINPSSPGVYEQLKVLLRRTIDHANSALNLIETWQPCTVVLIDRGYTPEGPMFEACMQNNITPITLNSAHKDNALILKRYDITNENVHPVSLSDDTWSHLKSIPWDEEKWKVLKDEIEYCYRSGQWYGEVATQFNTEIMDENAIKSYLGINPLKKTVLIFPHIFWDATFFWGEDVFNDYEEWFRETVKLAWENTSVNWIIKVHPANVVKNIRDRSNAEFSELTVLKEFGKIPDHIHVVPADTQISTLSLYQIGDVCLTVRGTVGIEAAVYGLTVVTAGTGRYDRLGFTIDVETREQYRQILSEIDNIEAPDTSKIELARRYAYGIFLTRPVLPESINFTYSKSREAKLTVSISEKAREDIFYCKDIQLLENWIHSGEHDVLNA